MANQLAVYRMAASVDATSLTFRQDSSLKKVLFDVWAGQYSSESDSLGGISKTVSASLKEEDYQKILRAGGMDLSFDANAKRGAAELRVVVRDVQSASVGSLRVPVRAYVSLP